MTLGSGEERQRERAAPLEGGLLHSQDEQPDDDRQVPRPGTDLRATFAHWSDPSLKTCQEEGGGEATHAVEEGQAAKVAKADEQARQSRAEQDPVDGRLLPVVERGKAPREEPLLACGDDEAAAWRGPVSP